MPTTRSALAGSMVAVDENNAGRLAIQEPADMGGRSTCG
jgi:hypothetical protein